MDPALISFLLQFPMAAAIYLVFRDSNKRFDALEEKREKSQDKRDEDWRAFLREQRQASDTILAGVINSLAKLDTTWAENKDVLLSHDATMRQAVAAMYQQVSKKDDES